MQVTTILSVVSPKLRGQAEQYAHKLGAAQTLFGKIRLFDEPGLLNHADTHITRWHRLSRVIVEPLPRDKQLLNIAERLVVAVRIESAAKAVRTSPCQSSPARR